MRPGCSCGDPLPVSAPTASRRKWVARIARLSMRFSGGPVSPMCRPMTSSSTDRRAVSIISTSITLTLTDRSRSMAAQDASVQESLLQNSPLQDSPLTVSHGTLPRYSATFDQHAIAEIQRAAATGIYDIRGGGAKRKLPHFDDLLFLGASISRYPLEG